MKRLLYTTLLLLSAMGVFASTTIVTPTICGHWTTSGSPYLIANNIDIPVDSTLTIDPGVEVIFQGLYHLRVHGQLIAAGTVATPILFHAQDTTGWYDDLSPLGGWHGIFFDPYTSSAPDHTVFEHCILSDMKYGGVAGVSPSAEIESYRTLVIKSCEFFHNQMTGMNGQCVILATMQSGLFTLEDCDIHDNFAYMGVIYTNNYPSGHSVFKGNKVHNNIALDMLFTTQGQVDVIDNDFYDNHNTGSGGTTVFITTNAVGTVSGNKIHHNSSTHIGPLFCVSSIMDIKNNLICNNTCTLGWCHFTDGGGGMMLQSGTFKVHNNIIANNYTNYTGGGVKVYESDAWIANNTIVNNSSGDSGAAIHVANVSKDVFIKNNIISNNVSEISNTEPSIYFVWSRNVTIDNNFTNRALSSEMHHSIGTIVGSTTHNIVNTDPLLLAPTTLASITVDATVADFSLKPTSPCINAGDTALAVCDANDYIGTSRIKGSSIDIGAYEYGRENTAVGAYGYSISGISIFPNPCTGNFFIDLTEAAGNIQVVDILNKTIFTKDVVSKTTAVALQNAPTGIYFVIWTNGTERKVEKMIVE